LSASDISVLTREGLAARVGLVIAGAVAGVPQQVGEIELGPAISAFSRPALRQLVAHSASSAAVHGDSPSRTGIAPAAT
jgi:hypothetical protein